MVINKDNKIKKNYSNKDKIVKRRKRKLLKSKLFIYEIIDWSLAWKIAKERR